MINSYANAFRTDEYSIKIWHDCFRETVLFQSHYTKGTLVYCVRTLPGRILPGFVWVI